MIENIKYLDQNTCLDMNDFNFMIGFVDDPEHDILHAMTEEEQVDFYKRMNQEFRGTSLDYGVRNTWFAEFNPTYCSNCDNCGEKFFLLERNGDIYSCVRGQKHSEFYYGNIYKDDVQTILQNAQNKIFEIDKKIGFNEECANCKYLYLCKTGCPFVRNKYNSNKSYTCKLQQEIYKDNPDLYPEDIHNDGSVYVYIKKMHPELMEKYYPKDKKIVWDDIPSLTSIIEQDPKLQKIYSKEAFILNVDGIEYKLESQILRSKREIIYLTDESKVKLYIKKGVLEDSLYPASNSLYMMLLSGNLTQYGDENRVKQEHIMTHQIFTNTIQKNPSDKENYYCVDISKILGLYYNKLAKDVPNNLFFTTSDWRDYHYLKHKNNAYYHIQAINLPFQNIEFFYINLEEELKND